MNDFESKAIGHRIIGTAIEQIYDSAADMTRDRLIEALREVCLSHARLQYEFDGLEGMYNAINPRSE